MKKTIIMTIVALSTLLSAKSLSPEQQQIKDMVLKINIPMLKTSKKIRKCTLSETKENYISCMQNVQSVLTSTKFGNLFASNMKKVDGSLWKDKNAIKELDETISQLSSSVACLNNPKTTDVMGCLK